MIFSIVVYEPAIKSNVKISRGLAYGYGSRYSQHVNTANTWSPTVTYQKCIPPTSQINYELIKTSRQEIKTMNQNSYRNQSD